MRDLADGFSWARKLKVRHLESLLVLEKAGTLTEAAARLHLTQSAMSHWLAEMESLVGAPIVVRGRQLELTPAGQLMKRLAISVLGDVSRIGQELHAAAQGKASHLHVGSVWAGMATLLPSTITEFQLQHEGVAVTVTEEPFNTLLERLTRRELDVVVGTIDARAQHLRIDHAVLFEDEVCVVAGRGSRLWGRSEPLRLSALIDENWVVPPHGTSMRSQLDSALVDAGVPWLQPKVETAAITTLLAMLNRGNYIGICSEEMTRYQVARGMLQRIEIDRVIKFGAVGVLWNRDVHSATVNDFVQIAKATCAAERTGSYRHHES
ncbi:MAG: LysR family transcriptional regulator [Burkholderiaceae bacterium]|jgi:DNA-binding transcriptional LysR family regulator|nr:LysR family transcriptional regulator [Burkholderiaceae bacterium]